MATDVINRDVVLGAGLVIKPLEVTKQEDKLDRVLSGLSSDVTKWREQVPLLQEAAREAEDRDAFATRLIRGVFDKIGEYNTSFTGSEFGSQPVRVTDMTGHQEVEEIVGGEFSTFFRQVIRIGCEKDRMTTQGVVMDYKWLPTLTISQFFAVDYAFSYPEMKSDDMLVDQKRMEFRYMDRVIKIDPPVAGAKYFNSSVANLTETFRQISGEAMSLYRLVIFSREDVKSIRVLIGQQKVEAKWPQ